jgi:tetratricopeptide (TPR) repeat protein
MPTASSLRATDRMRSLARFWTRLRDRPGTISPPATRRCQWLAAVAGAALVAGCTAGGPLGPGAGGGSDAPNSVTLARTALAAGNLDGADAVLAKALAPTAADRKKAGSAAAVRGGPDTPELLVLRAELRIRQGRFGEAESDALSAMALVPPTASVAATRGQPYGPVDGRDGAPPDPPKDDEAAAPRPSLTQRSIHIRIAQAYEDAGRDSYAEHHLAASRTLCRDDAELTERRECELERAGIVRILLATGEYSRAEPMVLDEIADAQSRWGADDIRLSFALCHVARFYARQGKYQLSGPLFARSFELWKNVREEAAGEHRRAMAAGQPSPFDAEFLRPRAGHAPFAAPCGLEDQSLILYKLGKAGVAAEAIRYEQQLWAADTQAGVDAVAYLDSLVKKGADALSIASARNAVAFAARRKGDLARAEHELRLVLEAYAEAWPRLSISDRRYYAEDYLGALESLIDILRSARQFNEAIALGETANRIAAEAVHEYDSLRLDALLSLAKTFREMRDAPRAVAAASNYLDAVVRARGDTSADYAWALRTISYAYLLGDELDASGRMEMQAKAIWAKQSTVAPEF